MIAMRPWLRVGKRLEITIAIIAVACFLGGGIVLTGNAPGEIRWIVWIIVAGFIFPFCFASFLALSWLRLRQNASNPVKKAAAPSAGAWAMMYLILLLVTAFSVLKQTSMFRGRLTLAQIFLLNLVFLAAVVALAEFSSWRKQR